MKTLWLLLWEHFLWRKQIHLNIASVPMCLASNLRLWWYLQQRQHQQQLHQCLLSYPLHPYQVPIHHPDRVCMTIPLPPSSCSGDAAGPPSAPKFAPDPVSPPNYSSTLRNLLLQSVSLKKRMMMMKMVKKDDESFLNVIAKQVNL